MALVALAVSGDPVHRPPQLDEQEVPKPSRPPHIVIPPTTAFRFDSASFALELTHVEAAPREPIRIYDPARTMGGLIYEVLIKRGAGPFLRPWPPRSACLPWTA
jgi:hypothetical protein